MPSSPPPSRRRSYSRSRSRSPPRRRKDDRLRASTGGFRWKDKSRSEDRPDDRHLERGYRDRDRDYRRRDDSRERERDRDSYRDRDYRDSERDRERDRERRDRDRDRNSYDERDKEPTSRRNPFADEDTTAPGSGQKLPKEKKPKKDKPPKIAPTAEAMIIVNVNDRLGTKAAIPCLASDSIRKSTKLPSCLFSAPLILHTTLHSCSFGIILINNYSRRFQENGSRTHRPRAPRDHAQTTRRETVQGSAVAGRLWDQ